MSWVKSSIVGSTAGTLREAYPRALSTLTRMVGSLDQAEDLLQEAAAQALVSWAKTGLPDSPTAWLVRVARNRWIDAHRQSAMALRHAAAVELDSELGIADPAGEEIGLRDDMLRLVFVCCHPVLEQKAQVALALKAVAGLTVEEIAAGFLVAPRTIEQRITRAKRRIRETDVRYEIPPYQALPTRLASVLAVLHLIFNEGHSASGDGPLIRRELCDLAIEQARMLSRLIPEDPEIEGLLALFLLTHARTSARLSSSGAVISLDRQDRTRWNQEAIREGLAVLEVALSRRRSGPFQIQAAMSACHGRSASWQEVDWPEIVRLYDALLAFMPTPVVRLNRAVAVSRASGPGAGLALVERLRGDGQLVDRHALYAVRAGLLEALQRWSEAAQSYHEALSRTRNPGESDYFRGKIEEMRKKASPHVGSGPAASSSE